MKSLRTMSFYVEDAEKYGQAEAVILYDIRYWIKKNAGGGRNYRDGRHWTFDTAKAFSRHYPQFSQPQIIRLLKSLAKQEAIVVGNYNKHRYDRTNWYALSDEKEYLDMVLKPEDDAVVLTKSSNGNIEIAKPIPNTNTDTKEEKTAIAHEPSPSETAEQNNETPPRKPKPSKSKTQNKDDPLVEEVLSYFNGATGKQRGSKEVRRIILKRIKEDGLQFSQFKKIVDIKTKEWLHDSRMKRYLTPETLFSDSKWERYLAEAEEGNQQVEQQTAAERKLLSFLEGNETQ